MGAHVIGSLREDPKRKGPLKIMGVGLLGVDAFRERQRVGVLCHTRCCRRWSPAKEKLRNFDRLASIWGLYPEVFAQRMERIYCLVLCVSPVYTGSVMEGGAVGCVTVGVETCFLLYGHVRSYDLYAHSWLIFLQSQSAFFRWRNETHSSVLAVASHGDDNEPQNVRWSFISNKRCRLLMLPKIGTRCLCISV